MSNKSNDFGRAYEYAWITALYNVLHKTRQVEIEINSSYEANKKAWDSLDDDTKEKYSVSAETAIEALLEMEPKMVEVDDDNLKLHFQKDNFGIKGDVRDIIIGRESIDWKIGLSIKHNHEAIKHSRLSYKLDFGKEWFNVPCSDEYWDAITPIFDVLKTKQGDNKKWSELSSKESDIYKPLLIAFIEEVKRAYSREKQVPRRMVEYLIGFEDYYKIINRDDKCLTLIRTFNIHNTLNQPSKTKVSAITVPIIDLPTRLIAIEMKPNSNNTVEMFLDNGWSLSFRIHNASTIIEPSLKFDIQFIGMPLSVLTIECKWTLPNKN